MLVRIDMMCILCEELDDHPTSQTEFEVNFTSRNLEMCAPFFGFGTDFVSPGGSFTFPS